MVWTPNENEPRKCIKESKKNGKTELYGKKYQKQMKMYQNGVTVQTTGRKTWREGIARGINVKTVWTVEFPILAQPEQEKQQLNKQIIFFKESSITSYFLYT